MSLIRGISFLTCCRAIARIRGQEYLDIMSSTCVGSGVRPELLFKRRHDGSLLERRVGMNFCAVGGKKKGDVLKLRTNFTSTCIWHLPKTCFQSLPSPRGSLSGGSTLVLQPKKRGTGYPRERSLFVLIFLNKP